MGRFPQYRFEHFYRRGFREGGLTFGQLEGLIEFIRDENQKRAAEKEEEYKLFARLHGFQVKGADEKTGTPVELDTGETFFYNGDPNSVAHLPMAVREEMTRKMMGQFRGAAGKLQGIGAGGG